MSRGRKREARPKPALTEEERTKIIESMDKLKLEGSDFLVLRMSGGRDGHFFARTVAEQAKLAKPDWLGHVLFLPDDMDGLEVLGWLAELKMTDIEAVLKEIRKVHNY